ncbi:hypothetical protein SAMN05518849_11663 [Sphingobium sp. AP50]|uniref:hypothetical protein n=1 Tax=Sphingobium sp. AP50 TaxID=1884369 RepID=UPI0008BC1613|nr:hypothetical protein [Sphingobium sp. AP50]SEJ87218.1 hypothetical protein SAMN05518849_11663 [Sphingobium sp. AP50]
MFEAIDFLARMIGYGVLIIGPMAVWVNHRRDMARREIARTEHEGMIRQMEWAKENAPYDYPRLEREYEEYLRKKMNLEI